MPKETTRREVLKGGVAMAGLGVFGVPEWAFPALAQNETLVEFTDLPEEIVLERTPDRRIIGRTSHRRPDHARQPVVHDAALRASGRRPRHLPAAGVRDGRHAARTLAGRSARHAEPGTGVRLRVLRQPRSAQRSVEQRPLDRRTVAYGARAGRHTGRGARVRVLRRRHGEEEVEFRGRISTVDQQYGRSLQRDIALSDEPLLAYQLNGELLTLIRAAATAAGARLVRRAERQVPVRDPCAGRPVSGQVSGALVSHAQGEMVNGEMKWKETAITKDAVEVLRRAGDQNGEPAQGVRRDHARRHPDRVGRGSDRRWTVAAGDSRSVHKRKVTPGSSSASTGTAPPLVSTP